MTEYQHTIKSEVSLRGVGVHSGETVRMTLKPAAPDQGVVFVRSDLPCSPPIPALIRWVSGGVRGTSLCHRKAEVMTVEHLLATLHGLGVDNLVVEMDGPEPPMGDGSALPFLDLIKTAGLAKQSAPRRYLSLLRPVYLVEGEGMRVALPGKELRIAFTIDFGHPQLRSQFLSLAITPEVFEQEISPARTFGFLSDACQLMEKGLIRGSSLDNTVVIADNAVISREGLRFQDEFVRHKILDLVGDLYLLGRPLRALLIAVKSGHALNLAFVQKMQEVLDG